MLYSIYQLILEDSFVSIEPSSELAVKESNNVIQVLILQLLLSQWKSWMLHVAFSLLFRKRYCLSCLLTASQHAYLRKNRLLFNKAL